MLLGWEVGLLQRCNQTTVDHCDHLHPSSLAAPSQPATRNDGQSNDVFLKQRHTCTCPTVSYAK